MNETQSRAWHCQSFLLISSPQRSSWAAFLCLLRKPIVFHIYCLGKDVKKSTEHSERCQRGTLDPPNLTQVEVITYLVFVVFKNAFSHKVEFISPII